MSVTAPSRSTAPQLLDDGVTQKARILVVEDDAAARSALKTALRQEGYHVRAMADANDVAALAHEYRPDLAILEVCLSSGPDGYEIARRLRNASDHPLLFVTAADSLEARLAGFEAGADDYLIKPFSMDELLARVQAVLRRSGRLASAVLQVGDLVIHEAAVTAMRGGTRLHLTRMEFDLLAAMARSRGQVLSKTALLTRVWGYAEYNTNLVEVVMCSLRRKLEAHGPRLIHTVRNAGYVLRA